MRTTMKVSSSNSTKDNEQPVTPKGPSKANVVGVSTSNPPPNVVVVIKPVEQRSVPELGPIIKKRKLDTPTKLVKFDEAVQSNDVGIVMLKEKSIVSIRPKPSIELCILHSISSTNNFFRGHASFCKGVFIQL